MLISAENNVGEKICHTFQQRRSQLALKLLKAGRCRLHLPGFEGIYQDLAHKKRSPKSFDSEDLK